MKDKYIELMGKALSAYTDEHIIRYFDDVRINGLKEHGFARLTSNIGILIAHGVRCDLKPLFIEMMDFCCKTIPTVLAANDFTVREIICCLREIQRSGVFDPCLIKKWKENISKINPKTCYSIYAKTQDDLVKNWALFTGVSEFFRQKEGLCSSEEFIETQIGSQLKWIEENGMYMDNESDVHHPIVYDVVARGLFVLLLNEGYRGRYYEMIDDCLRRSALVTLKMQSPNGEIAFGGRSNQFLHNEPWLMAIYEYEARRYVRENNLEQAKEFKSAIKRALGVTEFWLNLKPIRHIKNRFKIETKHGCEKYAYFDKYMITTASFLYAAYLVCDDTIPTIEQVDVKPTVFTTTYHFHKVFAKAGGYGLEFDINADNIYDTNGLGRVHRAGAPSTICVSTPCAPRPSYTVPLDAVGSLSFCVGVFDGVKWLYADDNQIEYRLMSQSTDEGSACVAFENVFPNGRNVFSEYIINASGINVKIKGSNEICYVLPAFLFDGESYTEIKEEKKCLEVHYNDWICRYTTDGEIIDARKTFANRNGFYKKYMAVANKEINLKIEIFKQKT